MKVRDIMSDPAQTCTVETWVAQAARVMRSADCGVLPVVDSDDFVVGVITDRDICMAVAQINRSPRAIRVHEVMTHKTVTVSADDEIGTALATMKREHVRRLPVLDTHKHLVGLLSFEDVVVRGLESQAVSTDDVVATARAMYERRLVPVKDTASATENPARM